MASQPIYQFYAELSDYQPKIWRRFQVANTISMARLGYIVMTLFEMQGSHLFCFDVPAEENFRKCVGDEINNGINRKAIRMFSEKPGYSQLRVELPGEDGFTNARKRSLDARLTKVKNILTHEKESMTFTYDFGDSWMIRLVLETIIRDEDLPGKELPRVLDGERFGIIEDCGGPGGLDVIAKAFKMKRGSKYKEYCDWLGTADLDLGHFDIDDMNYRLKRVPRIYANSYEKDMEPSQRSIDLLARRKK
jgi:hypothetical protein